MDVIDTKQQEKKHKLIVSPWTKYFYSKKCYLLWVIPHLILNNKWSQTRCSSKWYTRENNRDVCMELIVKYVLSFFLWPRSTLLTCSKHLLTATVVEKNAAIDFVNNPSVCMTSTNLHWEHIYHNFWSLKITIIVFSGLGLKERSLTPGKGSEFYCHHSLQTGSLPSKPVI